jgi:hypothetical protein
MFNVETRRCFFFADFALVNNICALDSLGVCPKELNLACCGDIHTRIPVTGYT